MRYPPKFVQRVGLLSSLLFVGVLGGLMVPLSSEAGTPTVTLKVDSGTASSILVTTTSTCTATEVTLGYTACYAINTNLTVAGLGAAGGVQRSYNVRNAPGATARLRVGDNAGSDKFSLIGVQFIPAVTNWGSAAANANETHVLTITMSQTFDAAANLNNKGTYVWALRAGGEFRAGPTTAGACAGFTTTGACNNLQNSVTFPGTGTFSTALVNKPILSPAGSAANTQPLSFTVAGPTAAVVSFNGLTNTTLGQVNPTYPSFICDLNGGALVTGDVCKPSITQTMKVTLKGPDAFVLVNGGDNFAANCAVGLSNKQERQIAFLTNLVRLLHVLEQRRPNPRLSAFIDKLETFLATINSNPTGEGYDPPCPGARLVDLDIAVAAAADQVAFMADGAVPGEPAPPAPQTGTITITKTTTQPTGEIFTFHISGPSTSDQPINMDGTNTESIVVTVDAGTYGITENPLSGWSLTSSSCTVEDGSTLEGPPLTNIAVPAGGNVSCTFNNSFTPGTFIQIVKFAYCGACSPYPYPGTVFNFRVDGPSASVQSITPIDNNYTSIIVPVIPGTYSVSELEPAYPWFQNYSECGADHGPTTDVMVVSGTMVTCLFSNMRSDGS